MTFWNRKPNEPDHWNKRPMVINKKPEIIKEDKDKVEDYELE